MQIKKIIVDKKPNCCGDCCFCITFYDDQFEEYYEQCVIKNEIILDTEDKPNCGYF